VAFYVEPNSKLPNNCIMHIHCHWREILHTSGMSITSEIYTTSAETQISKQASKLFYKASKSKNEYGPRG